MSPILYEDKYLLALNKPAGLQVESDKWGNPSLQDEIANYLHKTYPWKKQLIAGVAHRLDRAVSGAVVFAITPMALKEVGRQFAGRTVRKTYLAIVENAPPEEKGELVNWIKKDSKNKRAVIVQKSEKGAQESHLRYSLLQEQNGLSLVKIELLTGRYHQIRVQTSEIGCPIVGDGKYGSKLSTGKEKIYLHAYGLNIHHPKTGKLLELIAPAPKEGEWLQFSHELLQ